METLLIQLTNHKAYNLLLELEELNLIRVLKRNILQGENLSDQFEGKLSYKIAEEMQNKVAEDRKEWDKPNT